MAAPRLPTLAEIEEAQRIVGAVMAPTPQYRWPLLCERAGREVWVKHENHTPTGAFKVRGGLVYLERKRRANELGGGLVTATRGNHGQSVPFAASRLGVPVTVVVPEGNSVEKNAAMRGWGAELIVRGRDFDDAREAAMQLAEERELRFVPSFHPDLVCGVATYAMELLSAVPDLETIYVPIGLGSGICAVMAARDALAPDVEVVGVVAEGAPCYALSWEAGRVVETQTANTFADGMAVRVPMAGALALILAGAARVVTVTDDDIAAAMRALYSDTHNVAEGAGAAALAALLRESQPESGRRAGSGPAAVVLTGGNVDSALFAGILQGRTPELRDA